MTRKNLLQRTTRLLFLFTVLILFTHTSWAQTQSIIVQTSLTPSQLDPNQLAKFNQLSASSLHDNFQLVQVQNLSSSQVNGRVRLALPSLTCNDLIFTATKVEYISESEYYWYGIIDSEDEDNPCKGGFITLMAKGGEKFGAIVFDDYSYEFQELGNGIQAFSRFKVEAVDENECGINSNTPGYRSSSQSSTQPKDNSPSPNRIIPCQTTSEVRVLILWTQAAANIEANINNRIALAIAQTNQSYANSQVGGTLNLVLAGSQQINFNETQNIQTDVGILAGRADIQALRNTLQADIVVLLTNGNYGPFGVVQAIGPDFNGAYSITQTNAATGGRFTFAHEVGHLFGARHDNDPNGTIEHGYNFKTGWFIFTKQRYTLLATMPAGKTREQNYSNPDVRIKDKPNGTANQNNNAQQHRNTGAIVANFFANPNPTFTVNIDAFQVDCYMGYADAVVQCGTAPYTFNWEMSIDGFNYQPIGNTENLYFYFNCQTNVYINLKLTLTDATLTSQTVYKHIEIDNNYPARPAPGKSIVAKTEKPNSSIIQRIYPNPLSSTAQVELNLSTGENLRVDIIDAIGNVRKQIFNGYVSKGSRALTINTTSLQAGTYQLRVVSKGRTEYKQLIVIK